MVDVIIQVSHLIVLGKNRVERTNGDLSTQKSYAYNILFMTEIAAFTSDIFLAQLLR